MTGKRGRGRSQEVHARGERGCAPRATSTTATAAETGRGPGARGGIPQEVRRTLSASGGLPGLVRSLPGTLAAEEVARVFDAVSDPARLRLLSALAESPLCPCLLREIEPMTNSALSYHLRVLRRGGLVATATRSSYRIYEVTPLGRRLLSFARRDPNLGPRLHGSRG